MSQQPNNNNAARDAGYIFTWFFLGIIWVELVFYVLKHGQIKNQSPLDSLFLIPAGVYGAVIPAIVWGNDFHKNLFGRRKKCFAFGAGILWATCLGFLFLEGDKHLGPLGLTQYALMAIFTALNLTIYGLPFLLYNYAKRPIST